MRVGFGDTELHAEAEADRVAVTAPVGVVVPDVVAESIREEERAAVFDIRLLSVRWGDGDRVSVTDALNKGVPVTEVLRRALPVVYTDALAALLEGSNEGDVDSVGEAVTRNEGEVETDALPKIEIERGGLRDTLGDADVTAVRDSVKYGEAVDTNESVTPVVGVLTTEVDAMKLLEIKAVTEGDPNNETDGISDTAGDAVNELEGGGVADVERLGSRGVADTNDAEGEPDAGRVTDAGAVCDDHCVPTNDSIPEFVT